MGVEVERKALLSSGLLPPGANVDLFLWGEASSERLEMRQGLLFLAGDYWGFYGRDYDFYTPYAGFAGKASMLSQLTGPQAHHGGMTSYTIEGLSENDGEQSLLFFPDVQMYRHAQHEVEAFFEEMRQRVHNQLHPDAQVSFQKGLKSWNEGQMREAQSHLEQAYRLDPRSSMPPYYLGQLHLASDPQTAVRYLKEARQRGFSSTEELSLLLGQAYAALQDYAMAEKYLRDALQGGESALALSVMAEVQAEQGRMRDALRNAQRAAALEPNNLEAQALLAFCASQNGDFPTVERALRRLGDRIQDHPFVLVSYAMLAKQSGDEEQARTLLEQAVAIVPDFRIAQQLLERLPPSSEGVAETTYQPEQTRLNVGPVQSSDANDTNELTQVDVGRLEIPGDDAFPFQLKMSTWLLQVLRRQQGELVQGIANFSLQWAKQSLPFPDSLEACNLLLHGLQETFVVWLEPRIKHIGHALEEEFREQWVPEQQELKSLSDAAQAVLWRQMFAELDSSLQQVFQYSLGLMDGGLFLLFLQEQLEEAGTVELTAQQLTENLSLISSRLYLLLKKWANRQALEIARELGAGVKTSFSTSAAPPERTHTTPERNRESQPAGSEVIAAATRTKIEKTTPDLPRIAMEPQYSSAPRPDRPPRKRQRIDPVEQLMQEYIAAHHLLGLDVSSLNAEQLKGQLREKLRMWQERTGKEPDLYVRIEGGKPQIKIRPKNER